MGTGRERFALFFSAFPVASLQRSAHTLVRANVETSLWQVDIPVSPCSNGSVLHVSS